MSNEEEAAPSESEVEDLTEEVRERYELSPEYVDAMVSVIELLNAAVKGEITEEALEAKVMEKLKSLEKVEKRVTTRRRRRS